MRDYRPIHPETQSLLTRIYRYSRNRRASQRAHCLLLYAQGKEAAQLQAVLLVSQKTIYNWLNGWDERGLLSLYDRPGRGRKQKLNDAQKAQIKAWVHQNPRQLKRVLQQIEETWNIRVSLDTLRRVLKSLKMSWRRMRRRPAKPASSDYACKRTALNVLQSLEAAGSIDLYYLDETGFTLVPPIPYAWQSIGQTIEVPSQHSKRLNVIGLMTRQGNLESYVSEQSITSDVIATCIDSFFSKVDKPTVIVMDQAAIHLGKSVQAKRPVWAQRGVYLFELPAYSPELNQIEILWRFIKYEWLDKAAYQSWESLVEAVEKVLVGFGQEFVINFA